MQVRVDPATAADLVELAAVAAETGGTRNSSAET